MKMLTLLTMLAVVKAQVQDQLICTKIQSVYDSICPNRRTQGTGETQDQIRRRNHSAEVLDEGTLSRETNNGNCDAAGELLTQKIRNGRKKHGCGYRSYSRHPSVNQSEYGRLVLNDEYRKYWHISKELIEAQRRIQQLEEKPSYCPLRYNGKCFWVEVNYQGIECDEARQICEDQGAKMADIYSIDHYYMLQGYLRMFIGSYGMMDAWLGMTYNRQDDSVYLSSGSQAPHVEWHVRYPVHDADQCCCMALRVRVARKNKKQFLINSRFDPLLGVICEK